MTELEHIMDVHRRENDQIDAMMDLVLIGFLAVLGLFVWWLA
jgi:hypothetical protein